MTDAIVDRDSIRALTREVLRFRDARNWKQFHNPKDMAISLALEAAELLELVQWKNGAELDAHLAARREALAHELSDVLYWVLLIAHDLEVDLGAAFLAKLAHNETKYPVALARSTSRKYTELGGDEGATNTDDAARRLWARTRLRVWDGAYWLVSLPHEELERAAAAVARALPDFAALVVERDEVSITLPDRIWREAESGLAARARGGPYAVITFDIDLDLDLDVTGYMLPAAARLADAGISIVPQCAYLKDHLLVREADAGRAVETLEALILASQSV